MPKTPEQEKYQPVTPKEITQIPEAPKMPKHIEKGGVVRKPTDFTAQVTDDSGKPLIRTPSVKQVEIELPVSKQQLASWSKGSVISSLTWLSTFWLRMIKKAVYFGWNVVVKGGKKDAN